MSFDKNNKIEHPSLPKEGVSNLLHAFNEFSLTDLQ